MSEVLGNIKGLFCIALVMLLCDIRWSFSLYTTKKFPMFRSPLHSLERYTVIFSIFFVNTSLNLAD